MLQRPNYEKFASLFDETSIKAMHNMIEADEFLHAIEQELTVLGPGVVRALNDEGVKIKSAGAKAHIKEMSETAKHMGIKLPVGTQGVFIPFDRTLYILVPEPGVIVHELGHAWDFQMGKGGIPEGYTIENYLEDSKAVKNIENAKSLKEKIKPFKTMQDQEFLNGLLGNTWAPSAYGSTSPQEFMAEGVRAFCNINDTGSLWDEINAPKYRSMNRSSFGHMMRLFHHYNGRNFEKWRHYDGL